MCCSLASLPFRYYTRFYAYFSCTYVSTCTIPFKRFELPSYDRRELPYQLLIETNFLFFPCTISWYWKELLLEFRYENSMTIITDYLVYNVYIASLIVISCSIGKYARETNKRRTQSLLLNIWVDPKVQLKQFSILQFLIHRKLRYRVTNSQNVLLCESSNPREREREKKRKGKQCSRLLRSFLIYPTELLFFKPKLIIAFLRLYFTPRLIKPSDWNNNAFLGKLNTIPGRFIENWLRQEPWNKLPWKVIFNLKRIYTFG